MKQVIITDPETGRSRLVSGMTLIEVTATAIVPSNERALDLPAAAIAAIDPALWRKGSIKFAPDGTFTGCETARSNFRRRLRAYSLPLSSLTYLVRQSDEQRLDADIRRFEREYASAKNAVVSNWASITANWQASFGAADVALIQSVTPSAADIAARFGTSVGLVEVQPHGGAGFAHVEQAVVEMTATGFQYMARAIVNGRKSGKGYLTAQKDLLLLAQQVGNFSEFSENAQKLEAAVRYCATDALVDTAYAELSDPDFLRSCLAADEIPDRLFVRTQVVQTVSVPVAPAVDVEVSEPDESGAVTATATAVAETATLTCVMEGPKERPLPKREADVEFSLPPVPVVAAAPAVVDEDDDEDMIDL